MALNIPFLSEVLFLPMKLQADRIYRRADVIMAVSNTYVARGKKCNPKADELCIYIGTDSRLVAEKTRNVIIHKPEDEFWIGYVGALGHSYDIESVISAIKLLTHINNKKIVFKIMGDGVLRKQFELFAKHSGVLCDFSGFLEYGTMMRTLKACDIAVNPIIGNSVSSIINKVSDYAAAAIPVVNTQNSPEYRDLLEKYNAGINVRNGNISEIANAIMTLYQSPSLRQQMSANAYKLYEDLFDRQKTYYKIIDTIEKLA